jgi:hypothetical protein
MREFAKQFGGVVVRGKEIPFGELPASDPALRTAWSFLDDFAGTKNSRGEIFSCDLQIFENLSPNAVCGLERGRFCLGTNVGLNERILELAAMLVRVMILPERGEMSPSLLRNAGFGFLNLPDYDESHRQHLEETVLPVYRAGLLDVFLYTSNILLLFALFHEINHATAGHASYWRHQRDQYLGELGNAGMLEVPPIQLLFELDADTDAFATIAINILSGRTYFSAHAAPPLEEPLNCFKLFWAGTILLANTWALSEPAGTASTTHPPALDRLLNLWFLPLRFRNSVPHPVDRLEALEMEIASFLSELVRLDESFARVGAGLVEGGRDRYFRMIERMDTPQVRAQIRKVHEYRFDPKTMPITTEK